jgi:hypothetical protein
MLKGGVFFGWGFVAKAQSEVASHNKSARPTRWNVGPAAHAQADLRGRIGFQCVKICTSVILRQGATI